MAREGTKTQAVKSYLSENPKTPVKDVVAALKSQGIGVSEGLVKQVLYAKGGKKKGGRKKRVRANAAAGVGLERGAMTRAVKEYLDANSKASPKKVAAALAERGIIVSVGLVSNIKYSKRHKKRGAKRVVTAARATSRATGSALSAADLIEAKKLVDQLGGVAQARKALETLEQLQ